MLGSLIGGLASAGASLFNANRNLKFQKQAATKSVQWKVADAKKAGVHPVYALGAPSFSPSPVNLDATGLQQAGQSIDRAIHANSTKAQQDDDYTRALQRLTLTRGELENQLLASRIAVVRQSGSAPTPTSPGAMLVPGQGNSAPTSPNPMPGIFVDRPLKRTAPDPVETWREGAAVSERGWLKTPDGYVPAKSDDAARRLEDDHIGNLAFAWRNYVLPSIGLNQHPPSTKLPKGQFWYYDLATQQYLPHKRTWYGAAIPNYLWRRGKEK